jgi:hypothetical protein
MLHQVTHIITGLQVVSDQDFIKHDLFLPNIVMKVMLLFRLVNTIQMAQNAITVWLVITEMRHKAHH